jgi:hypothetical protein
MQMGFFKMIFFFTFMKNKKFNEVSIMIHCEVLPLAPLGKFPILSNQAPLKRALSLSS